MKRYVHKRRILSASDKYANMFTRVYAEDDPDAALDDLDDVDDAEVADESTSDDYDSTTGDKDDVNVPTNVQEAFDKLIAQLRKTSYPNLPNALNKILKDKKLFYLLDKGFGDGELAQVKMSSETTSVAVQRPLPTQNEIGLSNSLKFPLKQDCSVYFKSPVTIVSPIITLNKTWVIDGHHRWSQLYMINPEATITAINFEYTVRSPMRMLRNMQAAIAVSVGEKGGSEIPRAKGDPLSNVYDMSENQIREYIDSNMQDVCWKSLVKQGVCSDRESAIEYILKNAMQLKEENTPHPDSPDRIDMPQTDDDSIEVAQEGQTNV